MIWRLVMVLALAFALVGSAFSQDEADAPPDEPPSEEAAPETGEEPAAAPAELEPAPEPAAGPPTPAPWGPPPPGAVLLRDNFDSPDAGVLPKSSPEPARYVRGYKDGEYQLQRVDPQWTGAPSATIPGSYGSASVAADVRLVGDTDGRAIGLYCRLQPTPRASGYVVWLLPHVGVLRLYRVDGGALSPLAEGLSAAAIRRGSQANRLELTCAGSVISASVNGTRVGYAADSAYREGRMAVAATTVSGTGLVESRVDNLVVTQRAEETPPAPGPYDGLWSGTIPIGRGVSFRVRDNTITSMTVDYQVDGNSCWVAGNPTLTPDSPVNIENNAFSARLNLLTTLRLTTPGRAETFPGALTFTITGRFASATSASGELDIALSAPETDPPCQGTVRTTWTATRS